jgi:hypothetical protein
MATNDITAGKTLVIDNRENHRKAHEHRETTAREVLEQNLFDTIYNTFQ